jgi:hypothetical protein
VELGAAPVTVAEAARSGELVVVTIPEHAVADLPKELFTGVPANVVVIDTGNVSWHLDDGVARLLAVGLQVRRLLVSQQRPQ